MTKQRKPGDIHTFDYQADIFGGRYRLIKSLGGGKWLAEHMEPTDEELDAILATAGQSSWDTPERVEAEALRRIEDAGTTFTIHFVSAARYAEAF